MISRTRRANGALGMSNSVVSSVGHGFDFVEAIQQIDRYHILFNMPGGTSVVVEGLYHLGKRPEENAEAEGCTRVSCQCPHTQGMTSIRVKIADSRVVLDEGAQPIDGRPTYHFRKEEVCNFRCLFRGKLLGDRLIILRYAHREIAKLLKRNSPA